MCSKIRRRDTLEQELIQQSSLVFHSYFDRDMDTFVSLLDENFVWIGSYDVQYCFSLIKGKKTPLGFRFVFSLSPKNIARLIEQNKLGLNADDIQGLYLNLRYDSTGLQCITGTSFKSFSMDKSLEHAWDNMVQKFFQKKGLDFEIL